MLARSAATHANLLSTPAASRQDAPPKATMSWANIAKQAQNGSMSAATAAAAGENKNQAGTTQQQGNKRGSDAAKPAMPAGGASSAASATAGGASGKGAASQQAVQLPMGVEGACHVYVCMKVRVFGRVERSGALHAVANPAWPLLCAHSREQGRAGTPRSSLEKSTLRSSRCAGGVKCACQSSCTD
jgi:hypothetical protein